jgi:hypothetical protein
MYLTAPAGVNVRLLSASITNSSNGTNQQLEAILARISALGTPAATLVTITQEEVHDQASQSVVYANVTSSEPSYAAVALKDEGFASLSGWYYQPMPEERPLISATTSVGLKLNIAPTVATDFLVDWTWVEEG